MELSGYLAVARRWWWTLLVATWVAGVSGYVVASQIPPTYEAESQLLVGPYNTDRDTLAAAGDLVQTYSQLVTTTPLLESAINESGADITPADLALATRVTANDTTRFLSIRVQDTDPQMAATLANKLADEITQLASRGTSRPEGQIQPVQFAVPPTDPIAPQKSLIVGLAALAALIGAMAVPLLVIAVTSVTLWDHGPLYRLAVIGQAAVYGLGAIGLGLRGHPAGRRPWFSLPAFFVLVNVASLHAAWNLLTGRRIDRWQPVRAAEAAADRSVAAEPSPAAAGSDR